MNIVQKGETVYIGARKFVEGDIIPPFVGGRTLVKPEIKPVEIIEVEKPKRTYNRRIFPKIEEIE
jgi:hypothetical protein